MGAGVSLDKGHCRVVKAARPIEGPALSEKVINGGDRIGATLADLHGGILGHAHGDQFCI